MIADEYVFDEHPKPQEIEDFLEGHPQNNLLQHARWSQVKENWSMKQVVVRRGGTIRALSLIHIFSMVIKVVWSSRWIKGMAPGLSMG